MVAITPQQSSYTNLYTNEFGSSYDRDSWGRQSLITSTTITVSEVIMNKKFFCNSCCQINHIMEVEKLDYGLAFTEHKLGKGVTCDKFVIANEDMEDLQKLLDGPIDEPKTHALEGTPATVITPKTEKKEKESPMSI